MGPGRLASAPTRCGQTLAAQLIGPSTKKIFGLDQPRAAFSQIEAFSLMTLLFFGKAHHRGHRKAGVDWVRPPHITAPSNSWAHGVQREPGNSRDSGVRLLAHRPGMTEQVSFQPPPMAAFLPSRSEATSPLQYSGMQEGRNWCRPSSRGARSRRHCARPGPRIAHRRLVLRPGRPPKNKAADDGDPLLASPSLEAGRTAACGAMIVGQSDSAVEQAGPLTHGFQFARIVRGADEHRQVFDLLIGETIAAR